MIQYHVSPGEDTMRRRDLLKSSLAVCAAIGSENALAQRYVGTMTDSREYWFTTLDRVCRPVITALAARKLRATMPIEAPPERHREKVTHLEAMGRTLSGIAPWLENGETTGAEGRLLAEYRNMAREAIAAGVDPSSPDYMNFGIDNQNIVDSSYLALAILRAPHQLREQLPPKVRAQLAEALRKTRPLVPAMNNWLLFTAVIEACLFALGEQWDRKRVDFALQQHQSWYLGDGVYGDGPHFHWDYYNSYVIHPHLLQLMDTFAAQAPARQVTDPAWNAMAQPIMVRAQRYAAIEERMIHIDGSWPVLGRSITYRCGAFHLLADISLRQKLPAAVTPAQVRGALGAAIDRSLAAPNTFDNRGWLRIGLAGHQPGLGESYISTGSLYLCTNVFLPLGLKSANAFWAGPAAPWTAKKIWSGQDMPADHAITE
jgi:hypothetical protein